MAYADYTYYVTSFFGTAIAESDFPRLALLASAEIDLYTHGRSVTDTTNTAAIKNAMCAVAEEIYSHGLNSGVDGITSESQGQYSVSYSANSSRALTYGDRVANAIYTWLGGTSLLFAGFYSGEYGTRPE